MNLENFDISGHQLFRCLARRRFGPQSQLNLYKLSLLGMLEMHQNWLLGLFWKISMANKTAFVDLSLISGEIRDFRDGKEFCCLFLIVWMSLSKTFDKGTLWHK